MAQATCPHCGGHTFETQQHYSNVNYHLVVCSTCGAVVGAFAK